MWVMITPPFNGGVFYWEEPERVPLDDGGCYCGQLRNIMLMKINIFEISK